MIKGNYNAFLLMKLLLIAYGVTGAFLLVLAFVMYKAQPSSGAISVGIIFAYIFSTFLGGFMLGRKVKEKRYLWGLLFGVLYFLVIFFMSMILNKTVFGGMGSAVTVFIMCTLSSMVGGMIS